MINVTTRTKSICEKGGAARSLLLVHCIPDEGTLADKPLVAPAVWRDLPSHTCSKGNCPRTIRPAASLVDVGSLISGRGLPVGHHARHVGVKRPKHGFGVHNRALKPDEWEIPVNGKFQ